ncbi:DUF3489 domain-containing protein [Maricaulis alexandrii]|uniref:DUF3489 domain-containing protein n=1 Tax=Maricaulis alexandrii TaxID=2570354 RepID=UPI001108B5E0|nr:DUF3489 domain-containing protein [Maricaulis alexandrii]
MSKLTPTHLAILKSLGAQDGPTPVDQLSGLPASGAALVAHLDHLASRGLLTRTGKAIALTEVGQAALSEAPTKATGTAKSKPGSVPAPEPEPSEAKPDGPTTKKARLIALLTAEKGVTVPDLAAALEWLPHTTRAALTGLKKAGYTIDKLPPPEGSRSSRYKLVEAA